MKCPRCKEEFQPEMAALSREDNKTKICSSCGIEEALRAWFKRPLREVEQ